MYEFRLKEILDAKGITNISAFAREIDMRRWGVHKLITQQPQQIDLATIEKLITALDCEIQDLIVIVKEGKPISKTKIAEFERSKRRNS